MSVVASEGSITTTASAQTINAPSGAGTFKLFVNTGAMQVGDRILLECRRKARGADAAVQVMWSAVVVFGDEKIVASPWCENHSSSALDFRITRLAGTDRAYPWTVETP